MYHEMVVKKIEEEERDRGKDQKTRPRKGKGKYGSDNSSTLQ